MRKLLFTLVALILLLGLTAVPAQAANPSAIEAAVVKGLTWLAAEQQANGSWAESVEQGGPPVNVAATGLAVLKFEEYAKELGKDPFDTVNYTYANNVINGLKYIFGYANQDANGVHFNNWPTDVYCTGIIMMAVAASNHPNEKIPTGGPFAGQTYAWLEQQMLNWMVSAQNVAGSLMPGGWGYYWHGGFGPGRVHVDGWSDQSNSGYASIGLGAAQAPPPDGFGLTIPASTKNGLNTWINKVQIRSGPYAGGSMYAARPTKEGANILKAGNLLYECALVGDLVSSSRVQAAINFIQTYWNNQAGNYDGAGWIGNYQAMFCLMKGLEGYKIDTITIGGNPVNWSDAVSTYIANNQYPDGHWQNITDEPVGCPILSTAWALLTLEKYVPPPIPITYDINASATEAINPVMTSHTVTANVTIKGTSPTPAGAGVPVGMQVISGPNTGVKLAGATYVTDANGQVSFTYTASDGGADTIRVWVDINRNGNYDEGEPYTNVTYDTYYLLTVTSPYGKVDGGGWYKAGTIAKWSVNPPEVPMPGILGFFMGKLKPGSASGIEVMDATKTVTVAWNPDYTMPAIFISLLALFLIGGAFGLYRLWRQHEHTPHQP